MRKEEFCVVLVLGNLGVGGAERQALEIARLLPQFGMRAVIAVAEKQGALLQRAAELRIPVYDLKAKHTLSRKSPLFWMNMASTIQRLRRVCVTEQCKVVHSFLFWQDPVAVPAALTTPGVKAVITSRRNEGHFKDSRRHYQKIENILNRYVDAVVCNSQTVCNDSLRREKNLPGRLLVIRNGVDLDRFAKAKPAEVEQEFPVLKGADPLVLLLGSFKPQKRHDVFLRSLAEARKLHPSMKALLVGPDLGQRESAEKLIAELKLEDAAVIAGPRESPESYLAACDFLALSSDFEGMPNVVLEAMAAGKAVVSTRVAGADELVQQDETGFLVPIGDVHSMAQALGELAANKSELLQFGSNAQEFVRQNLTLEKMVESYVNLYHHVAGGTGRD